MRHNLIAGGQGILRPAGRSGNDPTIQLAAERRGRTKIYHQTPRGHQNASEIKFLWKDSDKQCPLIPELMPSLNPNPEPQAPGDYPDSVPSRQPQSEPESWWEKIPTPPDWIYNIPGKAIEQMFRQRA